MALKLFKLICILMVLLLQYSCKQPQTSLHGFNKNSWDFRDSVVFYFDIIDTSETKSVSFFLRNTLDYPYRNLFLLLETQHKSDVAKKDTVQYLISNKYGQWLGRGMGKMRDNYFILNENMLFRDSGNYKMIVRHGMRENPLAGINTLGFKIE